MNLLNDHTRQTEIVNKLRYRLRRRMREHLQIIEQLNEFEKSGKWLYEPFYFNAACDLLGIKPENIDKSLDNPHRP